jgi:hypothetical protein
MIISLFKMADRQRLADAFSEAVASTRRGSVDWNPNLDRTARESGATVGYFATSPAVGTISVDAACAQVFRAMREQLQVPCIDVFFQEKDFWEFALWHEGRTRVFFSVAPENWGEVDPARYFGTARDLADIWSVPVKRIENYMINWQLDEKWIEEFQVMSPYYRVSGKRAYPDDKHAYGELYQGLDFIRALGGSDLADASKFWVYLP